MLIQIIIWIFPFLQNILNRLCTPFRIVHVYLHVHTGKEISRELNEKWEKGEDDDPILDQNRIRSSLATGLDRPDENAVLVISFNRLEYAKRVALAPRNFALILLVGYFIITPLRFINPPGLLSVVTSALTDPVGALLHFYFFLGIFHVMLPSLNDWYYVFNTVLLNIDIRPIYIYHSILVYTIFTLDTFWRTMDFLISLLLGMLMFFLYLVGLFVVAIKAQGGLIRNPRLFFVSYKPPQRKRTAHADIEFWDMDEMGEL